MTRLTMAVQLKKIKNDIDFCKLMYNRTGEAKYKNAFDQLVNNYNEIIDLINIK